MLLSVNDEMPAWLLCSTTLLFTDTDTEPVVPLALANMPKVLRLTRE